MAAARFYIIALVMVLAALISVITISSDIATYAKKHPHKASDVTATPSKNDDEVKKGQDMPSDVIPIPAENQVNTLGDGVTPSTPVPTVTPGATATADCKTNPEKCPPPPSEEEKIPCPPGYKLKHGVCNKDIFITIHTKHRGSSSNNKGNDYSNIDGNLQQMASGASDFSNSNPGTIGISFVKTSKDIAGWYHVKGEIKNNSPNTLTSLNIKTHWYDAGMNIVGITTSGYTDPLNVESGRTATFDALQDPKEFTGTPKFYKLSYDWNQ
jgi:hypothetical protein